MLQHHHIFRVAYKIRVLAYHLNGYLYLLRSINKKGLSEFNPKYTNHQFTFYLVLPFFFIKFFLYAQNNFLVDWFSSFDQFKDFI